MQKISRLVCLGALASIFVISSGIAAFDDAGVFARVSRAVQDRMCPLISNPAAGPRTNPIEFRHLFVGNDSQNVYFLVEFTGDASKNVSSVLRLDTDMDQTTGCYLPYIPRQSGAEYLIVLNAPEFGGIFVGNQTLCAAGSDDFPNRGGILSERRGRFLALIVPISTFQILTPDVSGFLVTFDLDGSFGPAGYTFR